jgi:hypothetical protein
MGTIRDSCAVCGEVTAAGSPLYSDRVVVDIANGPRTFLCGDCEVRVRRSGYGGRLRAGDPPTVDGMGLLAVIDTLRTGQRY